MLGKLIKNEMRASAHSVANIYLAAAITAAIMAVGIFTGSALIKGLSSLALIIIACASIAVTVFSVISEFRKTMYGSVGYLSFTLPVKEWQLLLSKTLSAVIWILISYLFLILSFIAVYFYFLGTDGAQFALSLFEDMETYGLPSGDTLRAFFFTLAAAGVFKIIYLVGVLFLSITLANIKPLQRFGTFGNVIMFFAVLIVVSSISSRLGSVFDLTFIVKGSQMGFTLSQQVINAAGTGSLRLEITPIILNLLFGTGCFFINSHFMKTRINVK